MATYTPQSIDHSAIRQIVDADILNENNLNQMSVDNADNNKYLNDKVVDLFLNIIDKIAGSIFINGFDIIVDAGYVKVSTAGVLIYRHFYGSIPLQTIGAFVPLNYKVYADFAIVSDYNYALTINYDVSVPANTASNIYVDIADIDLNGVITWNVLRSTSSTYLKYADNLLHVKNTDTHTTSSFFYIGGDSLTGKKVLTESLAPMVPSNFRITNVNDVVTHVIDPLTTNSIPVVTQLAVTLRWGYDDIIGVGSGNQFTITNTGYTFNNDELKGYYIQFISLNKDIKIESNVGNVLQFNVSENVAGLNVTAGNPSKIHPNADAYYADANNVTGGEDYDSVSKVVTAENYGVTNIASVLILNVGETYRFSVRSRKGLRWSSSVAMIAGSYKKYNITQNYAIPFVAHHAGIGSVGADIGLSSTKNGFEVTISGWAEATNYEICWTTDNAGADFTNPSHEKKIIHSSKTDIVTSFSAEFSVAVRPLIAGQQVALPITKTVISGSGGLAPNVVPYAIFDVDMKSFTGTLNYAAAINTITISNITSYANNQALTLIPDLTDMIITIQTVDYRISLRIDTNKFTIAALNGGVLPNADLTAIVFNIGTSERSRRVLRTTLASDVELVKTDFDVQNFEGIDTLTVRVYQEVNKSTADIMIISQSDTPKSMPHVNQKYILGDYGDRILVVDFYDPAGLKYKNNISGRITTYGKPYHDISNRLIL